MTVNDNDVVRAVAQMQSHGVDDLLNVFHVRNVTGTPVAEEDFGTDVGTWLDAIYTCINAHVLNSIQYIEIGLYNVTQDIPMVSEAWPVLTFGTLDANDLPHGVALLQTYETATKNVQGKKYFGGLPVTDITDGGTWTTTLVTLAACILLRMVGEQSRTYSDLEPGAWSRTAGLFRPFTAGLTDYVPAYQRRRRPGTGG